MNKRFSFFSRKTLHYVAIWICILLLALNFLRTDDWTGDKEFYEFDQRDWTLFYIFLAEEGLIIIAVVIVTCILSKRLKATEEKRFNELEALKYADVRPGDYDFIWFDFRCSMRAFILIQEGFKLYVEKYDPKSKTWVSVGSRAQYETMDQLKKALYDDYRFFGAENYYYRG